MARIREIEDILFQVEEHPVFARVPWNEGATWVEAPWRKAIVDMRSRRVVGMVGRNYRVVTNLEAIAWGFHACMTAFPETDITEWNLGHVNGPASGSWCSVDILHSTATLDFSFLEAGKRPEAYGPFVRVTNSYNGLRALSFEIGFFRKVCQNGLILPQEVIRFRFIHLKAEIGERVDFEVNSGEFRKMRQGFVESLEALSGCGVSEEEFEPLARRALGIRKPSDADRDPRATEAWEALSGVLSALCARYRDDLGKNAYAVMNAVTDFASRPPENRFLRRDRHSLQKRAGSWVSEFSRRCAEPDFTVSDYLSEEGGKEPAGESEGGKPSGGYVFRG